MRITVTAARRDDILRDKAAYEEKKARNKAKEKERYGNYQRAQSEVFAGVEDAIRTELGDNLGELEINVDTRFGSLLSVKIGNDQGGPRRDPNAALTWSWSATLKKDGTVEKESSSWSGLEAVTLAQIDDLKRSVQQLEIINNMDWDNLLAVTLPNWDDYMTYDDMEDLGPERNFDQELLDADLEDAIGANVLIKAREGRTWRGNVYFKIERDSGSQYTVTELPGSFVEELNKGGTVNYGGEITSIQELVDRIGSTTRVRKANFMNMIYTPLQMIDF